MAFPAGQPGKLVRSVLSRSFQIFNVGGVFDSIRPFAKYNEVIHEPIKQHTSLTMDTNVAW